jgi:hypothetical protein
MVLDVKTQVGDNNDYSSTDLQSFEIHWWDTMGLG